MDSKKIGFWKQTKDEESSLPFPETTNEPYITNFVNKCNDWINFREKVIERWMTEKKSVKDSRITEYLGPSSCRLCGRRNGNAEYNYNGYVFPEGLFHYIVEHHIKIDNDFQEMIVQNTPSFFFWIKHQTRISWQTILWWIIIFTYTSHHLFY